MFLIPSSVHDYLLIRRVHIPRCFSTEAYFRVSIPTTYPSIYPSVFCFAQSYLALIRMNTCSAVRIPSSPFLWLHLKYHWFARLWDLFLQDPVCRIIFIPFFLRFDIRNKLFLILFFSVLLKFMMKYYQYSGSYFSFCSPGSPSCISVRLRDVWNASFKSILRRFGFRGIRGISWFFWNSKDICCVLICSVLQLIMEEEGRNS